MDKDQVNSVAGGYRTRIKMDALNKGQVVFASRRRCKGIASRFMVVGTLPKELRTQTGTAFRK